MAFNMKRPVIKGSVLHKASMAKAQEIQSVGSDADLISAANELGRSRSVKGIDYSIDSRDIKYKKNKNKNKKGKEEVAVEEQEKTMPTEKMPTNFERNVDLQEDIALPGDTPDYNYSGRIADDQEALTLAPKNFKLKPINIDSQDLRVKKATRNLSDPKVNIGKKEMEAIKKAEEDRRRANDPLLSEINDRRELKKAGPDNVDPLTREILDQSDRPKPDYTPEYRRNAKASKIDSVDAKLLPNNSDPKLKKAEIPAPKETKLAHENPKYAIKRDIEGQSLNLNNERKNTGYRYDYENDQWSFNNMPITESEVRPAEFKGIMTEVNRRRQLESNTPQQYPDSSNPIQKRDDGIWKRAVKGGKAQQNMRKSGYIPPEER